MFSKWIYYRLLGRFFLPLLLIVAVVIGLLYHQEIETLDKLLEKEDISSVELATQVERNALATLGADALYLAGQPNMKSWIEYPSGLNKSAVIADFQWFQERFPVYDQVRFLNAQGMEEIRLDRVSGQSLVVPQAQLQNKSQRYYFKKIHSLSPGDIYVSPFDLNLERGRIEIPLKPVIRIGTPVFNQSGKFRGSILLNYLGTQILDELRQFSPGDGREIWLLNNKGFWLLGRGPEQEWGFMFPERQQHTMPIAYPQVWEKMQNNFEVGRASQNQDLFTFHRLDINSVTPGGESLKQNHWYVLIFTPKSYIEEKHADVKRNYLYMFALVFGLLLIVCSRLAQKELLRAESEQKVAEQEVQYRELLEGAPDSIVVADQSGVIRMVNVEAERVTGYSRADLVGQNVEILLPQRLRENHEEYRQSYLENPVVRSMGASKELFLLTKSGMEIPVEISLSPLVRGNERLVTSIIRDITQRKQQVAHIKELNRDLVMRSNALKAINLELESFSYSVSHDLRAPLRAVDGFSQTIIKEYADKLDDRGKDRLERIRKAAQNMAGLIDGLLDLSRISRTDMQREEVSLSKLASEVLSQLQEIDPGRKVTVSIQPEMNAQGDARLLKVLLTNLISNAWKFTGQVDDARIVLQSKELNGEQVFSVQDNGAGFNMDYAAKLFGAFQRLHDAEEFPGTGIGLATAKRVINKHGGRIWAESEPGKGAVFYFTLGEE
ncbi:PAS domain S-box protein [Ketobacter sp. MCCC 1A13808]|uniref:sensor histidine kinase n=1 Tax=Ketobacter sp. MCCC 1A13808 TaxID=2602738 RepID=UPI0012EC683E|nr:PAS domain S-box protein [Ketobacter sp. MCCC 1A13808]MVF13633.1 PAS domain S-box protein [Ketobacter sp. MCCC 1A13808]